MVEHISEGLDGAGVGGGPAELLEAFRLHSLRTATKLIEASSLIRDQVKSGPLAIAPAC